MLLPSNDKLKWKHFNGSSFEGVHLGDFIIDRL